MHFYNKIFLIIPMSLLLLATLLASKMWRFVQNGCKMCCLRDYLLVEEVFVLGAQFDNWQWSRGVHASYIIWKCALLKVIRTHFVVCIDSPTITLPNYNSNNNACGIIRFLQVFSRIIIDTVLNQSPIRYTNLHHKYP